MIHLDATFVVDFLRETARRRRGAATEFLDSLSGENVAVSIFVLCELLTGVRLSSRPEEERERVRRFCLDYRIVYPAGEEFAEHYGVVQSHLHRSGQTVGNMDVLIATLALLEGARLVTRNEREFARIPDLEILSY